MRVLGTLLELLRALGIVVGIGALAMAGGKVADTALNIGAKKLVHFERGVARDDVADSLVPMRQRLRELEIRCPWVQTLVTDVAGTDDYGDLPKADQDAFVEYRALLLLGALGAFVWYWIASWKFYLSTGREFRSHQLHYRPAESRSPNYVEFWIYAYAWYQFEDAADFAEALRDRYESDWEPEMGQLLATCLYAYEVALHLPRLTWQFRRRFYEQAV